jgi:hypothetical protein
VTAGAASALAAGFVFRLALCARPLLHVDDLLLPDDAYLSLHLARSIAQGDGPLYGLHPTNGFQPLYVFLMAPVFALFPGDLELPVRVALLLLAACDVLGAFLLCRWLARRPEGGPVAALLFAVLWAVHPYFVTTALNGLETALAFATLALLLTVASGVFAAPRLPELRRAAGLGALVGLAALARIDAWLALPVVALELFLVARRSGESLARWAGALAVVTAAALSVYAPWLAYSLATTGEALPVSGRAVRFLMLSNVRHEATWGSLYGPMIARAATTALRWNAPALVPAAALLAILAARRGGRARPELAAIARALRPWALFGGVLFLAYTLYVFGPWYFARYLFPLGVACALATALLGAAVARTLGGRTRRGFVAAAAVALAVVCLASPPLLRLLRPGVPEPRGYMRIGLWARDHFPEGTRIGGSQTGAIGYFADRLVVVNLDGVVSRPFYDAVRAGKALDAVRDEGVRYLLWQVDIDFLERESRNASPDAPRPVLVGRIAGVRTLGEPWDLHRVGAASVPAAEAAVTRSP